LPAPLSVDPVDPAEAPDPDEPDDPLEAAVFPEALAGVEEPEPTEKLP
jgi:hypothetical protein